MKKIRNVFIIIILGLLLVLLYQNQEYLLTKTYIQLNLGLNILNFITPEINNLILLTICFIIGFSLSYFPSRLGNYRYKKKIKGLNEVVSEKDIKINELQGNLMISNDVKNDTETSEVPNEKNTIDETDETNKDTLSIAEIESDNSDNSGIEPKE